MFCLTIDLDWAHHDVIADTLDLVDRHDIKATWFVTHDTPALGTIRAAHGHELGLHPNFNPLLDGQVGVARDILKDLLDIVPEARSIRSHSLVRSSRLATTFRGYGLTHESNVLVPPRASRRLPVWRDFSGLVQVPIRWEDDVRLIDATLGEPAAHLGSITPLIVNFHPIHVFLNTCTIEDYEATRSDARDPTRLLQRRRPPGSGGTRDRLLTLLAAIKASGHPTKRLGDFTPE